MTTNQETQTSTPENAKAEGKKAAKLVKVRALRPFSALGRVINPGEIVEIEAAQAEDLVKDIVGPFDFFGERFENDKRDHRRHNLKKAELA